MRELDPKKAKRDQGCILCYSGSKHRYLAEVFAKLPDTRGLRVLDMFAGGGSLSTHLPEDYIITGNDKEGRVIDIHEHLRYLVNKYGLTEAEAEQEVREFCHHHISGNKDDKGYYELKKIYNTHPSPMRLFALTMGSNTNYIRFNNSGEQNVPFGDRYYNKNSSKKMLSYLSRVTARNLVWTNRDFRDFAPDFYDLYIIDPPYKTTVATYTENGGWKTSDEAALLSKCDAINAAGKKFMYFNQTMTQGRANKIVDLWSKKYKVVVLRDTTTSCSFQRKNEGKTVEVMITNW